MTPQLQQLLDLSYQAGVLKRGSYDQIIEYMQMRFAANEGLKAEAQTELQRLEAMNDHCVGDLHRRDVVGNNYRRALTAALTT